MFTTKAIIITCQMPCNSCSPTTSFQQLATRTTPAPFGLLDILINEVLLYVNSVVILHTIIPNGVVLSCDAALVRVTTVAMFHSAVMESVLLLLSCSLEQTPTIHAPPTDIVSDITCRQHLKTNNNVHKHTFTRVITSPSRGMANINTTAGDDWYMEEFTATLQHSAVYTV